MKGAEIKGKKEGKMETRIDKKKREREKEEKKDGECHDINERDGEGVQKI